MKPQPFGTALGVFNFLCVDHLTPYLQFQILKRMVSTSSLRAADVRHTGKDTLDVAAGISPLIGDCLIITPNLCRTGSCNAYRRNRPCPMIEVGCPMQDLKLAGAREQNIDAERT